MMMVGFLLSYLGDVLLNKFNFIFFRISIEGKKLYFLWGINVKKYLR